MSWDTDIDAMLATSDDVFSAGGVSSPCFYTSHDEPRQDGGVGSTMMMRMGYVMVRASMFPGLKQDDPVTVNGVAYRAAIPQLIQDGKMLQIMLGKA